MFVSQRSSSKELLAVAIQISGLLTSSLSSTDALVSVFRLVPNANNKHKHEDSPSYEALKNTSGFPPSPPSSKLRDKIIRCFCNDTSPDTLAEQGCAVCGQLIAALLVKALVKDLAAQQLLCLNSDGLDFTRHEWFHVTDCINQLSGPVIASDCQAVCTSCWQSLRRGCRPKMALANKLWSGNVPYQLKDLSYIEKLLVSQVRHNRCIVKVLSSRSRKMVANAISFRYPSLKIYAALPPSLADLDDVIAFIFTGPAPPSDEDFKRTPMLVRRKKVYEALSWLKLNHRDYTDLEISLVNLMSYPENVPPVVVDYQKSSGERPIEARSVDNLGQDDGTTNGMCPLTVHGITGQNYTELPLHALKALAIQHLQQGGKVIAIGREAEPETLWNNTQLYPMIFPWLFPYGLGGIGHKEHKGKILDLACK